MRLSPGMNFCFVDDARRPNPSRPGMGPLVGVGGVIVHADRVNQLERALTALCDAYGFPPHEEFKWSPPPNSWMHSHLTGDKRQLFGWAVLQELEEAGAGVMVVGVDTTCNTATGVPTHEEDALTMFMERLHHRLADGRAEAIVIADRPGGGRKEEKLLVERFRQLIEQGTRYVKPDRVALTVMVADSSFVRLIQAADMVTSATLAYVGGESRHSPAMFPGIRDLLFRDYGRIGGVGLKLHPDFKFLNLYHWLLGDETFVRFQNGWPLPMAGHPYPISPDMDR